MKAPLLHFVLRLINRAGFDLVKIKDQAREIQGRNKIEADQAAEIKSLIGELARLEEFSAILDYCHFESDILPESIQRRLCSMFSETDGDTTQRSSQKAVKLGASTDLFTTRQEAASLYEVIAEKAVGSGQWEQARVLFHQAAVLDSEQPLAEHLADLEALHLKFRGYSSQQPKKGVPDGAMFDALYIPTSMGASTFFQSMLTLHSEVAVPMKAIVDAAIESGEEKEMALYLASRLGRDRRRLRTVLVKHGTIAGTSHPDEIATRMAAIVKRGAFIQGVRPPFSSCRSEYKNQIHMGFGFSRLDFVLDNSRFNEPLYDITKPFLTKPRPRLKNISVTVTTVAKGLRHAFRSGVNYKVGKLYSDVIGNWEVLDLNTRTAGSWSDIFNRLLRFAGVQRQYKHPLLDLPSLDTTRGYLLNNTMRIQVGEDIVTVGLDVMGRAAATTIFQLIEIAWLPPLDGGESINPESHPWCVFVFLDQWILLKPKTRARLLYSGELETFSKKVLLPAFIEEYQIWRKEFEREFNIQPDDESFKRKVIENLGRDMAAFLKIHPHMEDSWQEEAKYL